MLKDFIWWLNCRFFGYVVFWNVRIDVRGIENLPKGKVVLAANHNHMWDPIILTLVVSKNRNKKIHFFAQYKTWKSPFKPSIMRNIEKLIFGKSCIAFYSEDLMEQIPVCTGMKGLNRRAFKKARYYLQKGDFVGIFPEGDIKNRKKNQLFNGVAVVAVENKVPIIPIYLSNDGKKNTISLKKDFRECKLVIGKPITHFFDKHIKTRNQFRNLAKHVLNKINKLKEEI